MYGFIITTAGEGLLARASAGEGLTLTEVWVGKGAVESAGAAKALTALLDPVAKATSTTPAVAGGQISMLVEYRNDMGGGLEEGFTLSEFGVMAKVGEDAPTLLYYAALGDRAQPVPPIAEGLDVHRFPVAVGVTGEVEVSLEYPAGVWVTHEELEEALAGIDLSGYIKATEKGKPGGVATLGEDGKVPAGQLPAMNYDPAGSAAAVQETLTNHINNKNNPHKVTAAQVGAASTNIVNTGWKLLWSKTTAGAEDWVAPDLFGGKSYKIGVLVIGGGGSGAAATRGPGYVMGGSSGRATYFTMTISPGSSVPVVVGKGGDSNHAVNKQLSGNRGGASSFNGITADGGSGGALNEKTVPYGAQCATYYIRSGNPFGGALNPNYMDASINYSAYVGHPNECFNPFEGKKILGAGGTANILSQFAIEGGIDPITKLGGSNGVYSEGFAAVSEDASGVGCGSGGALNNASASANDSRYSATSGKAGDGAVYIYVQGVA